MSYTVAAFFLAAFGNFSDAFSDFFNSTEHLAKNIATSLYPSPDAQRRKKLVLLHYHNDGNTGML